MHGTCNTRAVAETTSAFSPLENDTASIAYKRVKFYSLQESSHDTGEQIENHE